MTRTFAYVRVSTPGQRNVSTTLIHPGSEFKLVSRPSAGIAQGQGRYPAFVPDPAG